MYIVLPKIEYNLGGVKMGKKEQKAFDFVVNKLKSDENNISIMMVGSATVSYTHLDVYKRQELQGHCLL